MVGLSGQLVEPSTSRNGRAGRVAVVSAARLYRDGFTRVLADSGFDVVASAADLDDLLAAPSTPDVVLLEIDEVDAGTSRAVLHALDGAKVVVVGPLGDDCDLIAWIESGASAYVVHDQPLDELIATIRHVLEGETLCAPSVAAALLRRVSELSSMPTKTGPLTARELEIVELVESGLTNKEIARELTIEVATVKNHVHNILRKLGVHRRSEAAAHVRREGIAAFPRRRALTRKSSEDGIGRWPEFASSPR